MAINVKVHEEFTLADNAEHVVTVIPANQKQFTRPTTYAFIRVVLGPLQISVGEAITTQRQYATGEDVPPTSFLPGEVDIRVKGAAGVKFVLGL